METNKPKTGRNTTAITNPKTKSQNTTANTKTAGKSEQNASSKASSSPKSPQNQSTSKNAKSGFGRNAANASVQSKSSVKSSGMTASGSGEAKNQSWAKPSSKSGAKMEVSNEFCQLKDFDIASDVLGGQKALLKLYGTALCETDCQNLRNIINSQLSEVAIDQFDIFTYMNQRGMYPTEQAAASKVKQAITKYNQKAVFKKNQK